MRVIVFGTFDDLHPGHRYLLNEAIKRAGSVSASDSQLTAYSSQLFVVIARDANVLRIKGRAPLQSEEVRAAAVQHAFPHAHVILGDADDFLTPVRAVRPDLIVLGYDQQLPPGVSESDLGAPVERMDAFEPSVHKSSLRRKKA